jgi:hypothetical protein
MWCDDYIFHLPQGTLLGQWFWICYVQASGVKLARFQGADKVSCDGAFAFPLFLFVRQGKLEKAQS